MHASSSSTTRTIGRSTTGDVPNNVLNYAAGQAWIRPRDYFAAMFIGTIPGIVIFTYLASSISAGVVSPRQAFARILIAGALLAALALISRFLAGKVKARLGKAQCDRPGTPSLLNGRFDRATLALAHGCGYGDLRIYRRCAHRIVPGLIVDLDDELRDLKSGRSFR